MTDNAPAPRTGTAQVTVNIIRNRYMPEFRQTSFVKTIGEYWPLRRTVITTTASDNDPSSVSPTLAIYVQTFKSYLKLKAPSISTLVRYVQTFKSYLKLKAPSITTLARYIQTFKSYLKLKAPSITTLA